MIPSVRKVFIEFPSQAGLKNQIALLDSRVKSLEKDKGLLMNKCESHMAASATHAEGEKKARLDAEKTKQEMTDLKRKYNTLKSKYFDLKKSRWVWAPVLFPNYCSRPCREPGDQSFNSQSSSQSLRVEENSMHTQDVDIAHTTSRPKCPLPSRTKRFSRPMDLNAGEDSMTLDPPSTFRKRARKSAPEFLEGSTLAISNITQSHAPDEDPADNHDLVTKRRSARHFSTVRSA